MKGYDEGSKDNLHNLMIMIYVHFNEMVITLVDAPERVHTGPGLRIFGYVLPKPVMTTSLDPPLPGITQIWHNPKAGEEDNEDNEDVAQPISLYVQIFQSTLYRFFSRWQG